MTHYGFNSAKWEGGCAGAHTHTFFDDERAIVQILMLAPADPPPPETQTTDVSNSDAVSGILRGSIWSYEEEEGEECDCDRAADKPSCGIPNCQNKGAE